MSRSAGSVDPGSFLAAVLVGVSDAAGKYYFPTSATFLIYLVMISLLLWRPSGLLEDPGREAEPAIDRAAFCAERRRWRRVEVVFWLATAALRGGGRPITLASQIAITASSRSRSTDPRLCRPGIAGARRIFGLGAYTAGLLAKAGWGSRCPGCLIAASVAGVVGWVTGFVVVRVRHLALIMVTLGIGLLLYEMANRESWLTGGNDGLQGVGDVAVVRPIRVRSYG